MGVILSQGEERAVEADFNAQVARAREEDAVKRNRLQKELESLQSKSTSSEMEPSSEMQQPPVDVDAERRSALSTQIAQLK